MADTGRIAEVLADLELLSERRRFHAIDFYEPYVPQKIFHALGAVKRERLLRAGNQEGKAERNDMPVLTPNGWVPIVDLKVGDQVIGGDGRPCNVTGVFPQGPRETAELVFNDGASVIVDTEHLWKVRFPKHPDWQVLPTFALPDPKNSVNRARIPTTSSFMAEQPVPVEPYLLGVLLGDGCFRQGSVKLTTADPELAKFGTPTKRKYDYVVKGLTPAFRSLGLMEHLSKDKFVPDCYLYNSEAVRLAVLQGLMDTDGSAGTNGTYHFYSVSRQLVDGVIFLTRSLGGTARAAPKQTYFTYKGVRKSGQPSWNVTLKLPVCPFRLPRKVARWYPIERTSDRILYSVEPAGVARCTCIRVDSSDHTYVTKDFIVTHNTYCGGAEMTYHLTGKYPTWWDGRKFKKPVKAWCAGEGAVLVRDGPQTVLCGEPGVEEAFGTGMIPKELFADKPSLSRGVTDAYDTLQVFHETDGVRDGISTLSFKSYEQGRKKFQTKTLDIMWCDEEPPEDIYNECLARIQATNGFLFITFTPLLGYSTVVNKFLRESSPDRSDTKMTLYDAKHIRPEDYAKILASYPQHMRMARTMGEPVLGSGAIYPVDPESITENDLSYVPEHWYKLWGIDFGIGHPFAAVLIAWDKDADVIHVLHGIRMADTFPLQHAMAMKAIAGNVKVAWPQDGTERRDDGKPLSNQYKTNGLRILDKHATWPDGSISTEAGITEIGMRMTSNRFKVARSMMLGDWGQEMREYHREEDGLTIVKVRDDLMSATRIAVMQKRSAVVGPYFPTLDYGAINRGDRRPMADNVDFPLWGR